MPFRSFTFGSLMLGEFTTPTPIIWRIRDRLVKPEFPLVMGILNTTPDSFHPSSRVLDVQQAVDLAGSMLEAGAAIIDIGGASSRPGSITVDAEEELSRVLPVVAAVHGAFPDALLSIDTWRASVAEQATEAGASIVNDITAGLGDVDLLTTVASLHVPYILMHMQGTPQTMQDAPSYDDVVGEVVHFLSERLHAVHRAGIADAIVDPGFGFGKSTRHNYTILRDLERLQVFGKPILVGVSRKRMINEVLGTTPNTALNGTSILNTLSLMHGASILRVHDVTEAVEVVKLVNALRQS